MVLFINLIAILIGCAGRMKRSVLHMLKTSAI